MSKLSWKRYNIKDGIFNIAQVYIDLPFGTLKIVTMERVTPSTVREFYTSVRFFLRESILNLIWMDGHGQI